MTGHTIRYFSGKKEAWEEEAACKRVHPSVMFPPTGLEHHLSVKFAKSICNECPVQEECLNFALRTKQKFGIWGGKTEGERRSLLRIMRSIQ